MFITQCYKYEKDGIVYVGGNVPEGATILETMDILNADDGSAQTWNLFYNNGDYLLNTTSTMTGYTWVGSVAIPSHTV